MPPLRLKEDRGRGKKGRMGWRATTAKGKEGGPHLMRALRLKTKECLWGERARLAG